MFEMQWFHGFSSKNINIGRPTSISYYVKKYIFQFISSFGNHCVPLINALREQHPTGAEHCVVVTHCGVAGQVFSAFSNRKHNALRYSRRCSTSLIEVKKFFLLD